MRIRHRIPTVFSLYMVDVFCCALGCVLLIWLDQSNTAEEKLAIAAEKLTAADRREDETKLKLSAAEEHFSAAEARAALTAKLLAEAEKRAGTTNAQLQKTTLDRDAAYLMLADRDAQLDKIKADKKDLEKRLADALALARDLDGKVRDKTERVASLEKELATYLNQLNDAKATAALVPDLRKDLKLTKDKLAEEAALALALEKEIDKRLKELTQLNKSLAEMRDSKSTLEKTVDARDKDLAAAKVYKSKWEAAEERVQVLEKQMTEKQKELALAELNNATLTKDRKDALAELTRIRGTEEARFAGIQLTGKRVVFLVDMSGSMDLVDDTTEAPLKWRGVRETVAKIMRSLPELEKFQVLVFSDKVSYLFGDNGDWIDYDARTSSDKVFKALAAIKPKGGTNMYSAMEATFKLRASGLDTVYFLSDGLPNLGEGLTREQAAKMTEQQAGEVLGKVIRNKLKTDWNRPLDKQPQVRVNTIGFFFESPDVGAFLWALAREHDGSFVGMSKP